MNKKIPNPKYIYKISKPQIPKCCKIGRVRKTNSQIIYKCTIFTKLNYKLSLAY